MSLRIFVLSSLAVYFIVLFLALKSSGLIFTFWVLYVYPLIQGMHMTIYIFSIFQGMVEVGGTKRWLKKKISQKGTLNR